MKKMKKAIALSIFIVFVVVNFLGYGVVNKSNLNLQILTALAQDPDEGGGTWNCEVSTFQEIYERCPIDTVPNISQCLFMTLSCWKSEYGLWDHDASCSQITCSDCRTGLMSTVYNDCY